MYPFWVNTSPLTPTTPLPTTPSPNVRQVTVIFTDETASPPATEGALAHPCSGIAGLHGAPFEVGQLVQPFSTLCASRPEIAAL